MAPAESHWFDRLALGQTRRGMLKSAVAGAAGLTLLRTAPARAADPSACKKGCEWTSHQIANDAIPGCLARGQLSALFLFGYGPALGLGFVAPGVATYKGISAELRCQDRALLKQRDMQANCLEPYCPGFNPYGKSGPCEGVQGYCCACASSDDGYIPCVYPCDDPTHNCCPAS